MKSIAVYCGANPGTDPVYAQAARGLGRLLAQRGIGVVYGGGHVGLMGVVADAALAALYAQDAAKRVTYDFHQFLGAMGMTLEHPLHVWTYRLKFLTGELGGRGAQALAAADGLWGAPA